MGDEGHETVGKGIDHGMRARQTFDGGDIDSGVEPAFHVAVAASCPMAALLSLVLFPMPPGASALSSPSTKAHSKARAACSFQGRPEAV